jgi:hypothetical protein
MLKLERGMAFAVCSGSSLARAINTVQKIKSIDNESTYNHAGLIIDTTGGTFEALLTIRRANLSAYKGCNVIIVRHKDMTDELFSKGWSEIERLEGTLYPVPRLFLHLVGLAKFIHWRYPVCSELYAKFECACELRRNWWGINPDNLVDEWRISKYYDVIHEGILY